MATVGQQLLVPETGWQRINDTDPNINYLPSVSSWGGLSNTGFYNASAQGSGLQGGSNYNIGAYVTFKFKGTKLRVISYCNTSYSTNCTATIDGVAHTFSCAYVPQYQVLVFEIVGLADTLHSVRLDQGTNNDMQRLYIDAIDIDVNGYMGSFKKISNISDMVLGDRISVEYTATANTFGTFANLGKATKPEIPVASSATPDGTAYLYHVGYDLRGRMKLVCDRNIQHSISWDTLNTAGVASGSGLPIKIDGNDFAVRLLSGGISATDFDNEWDKVVAGSTLSGTITAGDNTVWGYSGSTWSLTSTTTGTYRAIRGGSSNLISSWTYTSTNTATIDAGFRPVILIDVPKTVCKVTKVTPTHMYQLQHSNCVIEASAMLDLVAKDFKVSVNGIEVSPIGSLAIRTIPIQAFKVGDNTMQVDAADGGSTSTIVVVEYLYRLSAIRTFKSLDGGYILNGVILDGVAKSSS